MLKTQNSKLLKSFSFNSTLKTQNSKLLKDFSLLPSTAHPFFHPRG
ncbi:hypothetical protein DBT_0928 [Dissulfuribacter thermophilus]|uniref:Uncharacterized protein n=1 Tax=Dissulfuribacter thermophilus TaxID=1156395 RepID=A0A1B9F6L7_9BACT|nr:hypothetical protein DBT_0928 [Dissulfuribacter thermophilus]